MKRKKPNGIMTIVDFAHIIHELLEIPIDRPQCYPTTGTKIVRAIMKSITDALHRGEDVYIKGFGKFHVSKPREYHKIPNLVLSAKKGDLSKAVRSPVPIIVKGRKKVFFVPSVQVMAMLNQGLSYHQRRAMSIWDKE